jgi:hypothetical protein
MESIAALGLASNIVQIIDFSSRIISHGREIYKSADGRITEHAVLDDAARHLSELLNSLRNYEKTQKDRGAEVADKQLIRLKLESEEVVAELQHALQKARVQNTGKSRKWQSVRQGLMSVRTNKEISALGIRLDSIRRQIDTAVLVSIRYTE